VLGSVKSHTSQSSIPLKQASSEIRCLFRAWSVGACQEDSGQTRVERFVCAAALAFRARNFVWFWRRSSSCSVAITRRSKRTPKAPPILRNVLRTFYCAKPAPLWAPFNLALWLQKASPVKSSFVVRAVLESLVKRSLSEGARCEVKSKSAAQVT